MDELFGKRLGFGFLRLPHIDPNDETDVDLEKVKEMVDYFLAHGFQYFDTAYNYLNYKSEPLLREALVERYPRDAYMITDKLPWSFLRRGYTKEGIFADQLEKVGVDYFDIYLLHGLNADGVQVAEDYGCFPFLRQIKAEGKARRIGVSFHDTAETLDKLLTAHPELDVVQLQLNYLDWEHDFIQSRACWEVCRKHGKPVMVMEPVKGGTLANPPEEVRALIGDEPPAHRALRFAASQEGVVMVLSGMSTLQQMQENTALFTDFKPLTEEEAAVLPKAARIIRSKVAIPCTGCSYCTDGCPAGIPIPRYFALYNEREQNKWQVRTEERYNKLTDTFPRANTCLECHACESKCPQKLPIVEHLKTVSAVYDK